jgi:tetratricopeptide (TPR) repeat protein
VWPDQQNPFSQREQVRLELAGALIKARRMQRAQAQLMTLSAELPTSSERRKEVGDLLMEAGVPRMAFQQYMEARTRTKGSTNLYALELARAAFAQNDFALAVKWANTATRENPRSEEARNLAKTASQVLESDPYQSGIGERRRAERVIRAFRTADARMAKCFSIYSVGPNAGNAAASLPGMTPEILKQVGNFRTWGAQLRSQMIVNHVQHRDDVQENAMRFVFQTEQFTAKTCSEPLTVDDTALIALSKERWSNE